MKGLTGGKVKEPQGEVNSPTGGYDKPIGEGKGIHRG